MLNRCLTRPITTAPHDVVIFADTPIVAAPATKARSSFTVSPWAS